MRSVMNISLPKELVRDINTGVKEGGFATKSEFMRFVVREWKRMRLAEEFAKMDKQKNWKVLKSLKDLR